MKGEIPIKDSSKRFTICIYMYSRDLHNVITDPSRSSTRASEGNFICRRKLIKTGPAVWRAAGSRWGNTRQPGHRTTSIKATAAATTTNIF